TLVAQMTVQRPNGTTICGPTTSTDLTCALDTTGMHTIVIADSAGTNTGGYSIAIQRLNSPTGCTALTFGAPPKKGTIGVAGEMDCFTFSGIARDQIRVRLVKTSGTLFPLQEVVRPNGTSICGPTTATDQTCPIDRTGTHTIIVEDSGGTNTGDYSIAMQRLNSPTGCTALTFGAPKTRAIGVAGEMDCFTFTDTIGDQMNVHVVETSGTLVAQQE